MRLEPVVDMLAGLLDIGLFSVRPVQPAGILFFYHYPSWRGANCFSSECAEVIRIADAIRPGFLSDALRLEPVVDMLAGLLDIGLFSASAGT